MNYQILPPPPILKGLIRHLWFVDYDGEGDFRQEVKTVVDDSSGIIFQHYKGESSFIDEHSERVPIGLLHGKLTAPSKSFSDRPFSTTGITFSSQGLKRILGLDAAELTDKVVNVEDIFSKYFVEELLDQKDQPARLKILCQHISKKIPHLAEEDLLVKDCCNWIRSGAFKVRMQDMAKRYQISERQLERRFSEAVGLSPKFFMRMVRFQYALNEISKGRYSKLSDIAYEFDYSDQSRFSQDLKRFTGYTPLQMTQQFPTLLRLEEKL